MARGRPIDDVAAGGAYRLRRILRDRGITQGDLQGTIRMRSGGRVSQAVISRIIVHREWPIGVNADDVKARVKNFLASHDVPAEEIEKAWDVDDAQAPSSSANGSAAEALAGKAVDHFQLPENEMLSQAARERFGIVRHPFLNEVQSSEDVYLSKDQKYIRDAMWQAARHGGFLAVVGESGAGKSTLRRDLFERIRRENEPMVVITPESVDKKKLTASHICDAIIADISVESPKQSLEAKARQVHRLLTASGRGGQSHVLLIEEAHDLTIAAIKYLKRFWEIEDGFRKLLGIVIIGQTDLADMLNEQKNYEAREVIRRIEVATLHPLNGNLEQYIGFKLTRAGIDPKHLFEKDVFDAIRTRLTRRAPGTGAVQSALYPLVVQNLIVKCLNLAAELGMPKVNADLIGRV